METGWFLIGKIADKTYNRALLKKMSKKGKVCLVKGILKLNKEINHMSI